MLLTGGPATFVFFSYVLLPRYVNTISHLTFILLPQTIQFRTGFIRYIENVGAGEKKVGTLLA